LTVDRSRRLGPARRALYSKYAPVLSMALACVAALVLCSPPRSDKGAANPAADADAAYRALVAQIWVTGSSSQTHTGGIERAATGGAASAGARSFRRDLFSPLRAAVNSTPRPAVSPRAEARPPRLVGVFIDGDSRRALIDGHLVSEGDRVSGYSVVEIAARWVLLEKDGASYRIPIGRKS
jgi:hypothetical protein